MNMGRFYRLTMQIEPLHFGAELSRLFCAWAANRLSDGSKAHAKPQSLSCVWRIELSHGRRKRLN